MKHIKPYKIFESQEESEHPGFPETEEEIHEICIKYSITNYTINDDLSIDVDGNVDLPEVNLKYLPLNFSHVSDDFNCFYNKLKTLKGAPDRVGGSFYCTYNRLTTLEGGPHTVGCDFYCLHNKLTSLKGAPDRVGGSFYCNNNQLTSLKGSPSEINGNFKCRNNQLTSLQHLSKGIDYNAKYTSFNNNPIYTIVNTFIIKDNAEDLIQEFNDYDIVRGDKVILNRLKVFINDFDLEMPNLDEVKEFYEIV